MAEDALRVFPSVGHLTYILDAAMLRPEAGEREYLEFLREAADARFRCVFVAPCYLPLARQELEGSGVTLGAPISFPLGFACSDVKKAETVFALQQGAGDLEVVINVSALRSRRYERVREDIAAVVGLARRYDSGRGEGHVVVKAVLETGYLNREEVRRGAGLAREAGADFVVTSSGFAPAGADEGEVAFLREVVGPGFGVKACGGIRDLAAVMRMMRAGASRVGTAWASEILQEYLRLLPWNRG